MSSAMGVPLVYKNKRVKDPNKIYNNFENIIMGILNEHCKILTSPQIVNLEKAGVNKNFLVGERITVIRNFCRFYLKEKLHLDNDISRGAFIDLALDCFYVDIVTIRANSAQLLEHVVIMITPGMEELVKKALGEADLTSCLSLNTHVRNELAS